MDSLKRHSLNELFSRAIYKWYIALELSNYVTKADLKKITGVLHQNFVKNTDFVTLKSDFYRLNFDKLETTLLDLSKSSNAVKKVVVKTTVYDELVKTLLTLTLLNLF